MGSEDWVGVFHKWRKRKGTLNRENSLWSSLSHKRLLANDQSTGFVRVWEEAHCPFHAHTCVGLHTVWSAVLTSGMSSHRYSHGLLPGPIALSSNSLLLREAFPGTSKPHSAPSLSLCWVLFFFQHASCIYVFNLIFVCVFQLEYKLYESRGLVYGDFSTLSA